MNDFEWTGRAVRCAQLVGYLENGGYGISGARDLSYLERNIAELRSHLDAMSDSVQEMKMEKTVG